MLIFARQHTALVLTSFRGSALRLTGKHWDRAMTAAQRRDMTAREAADIEEELKGASLQRMITHFSNTCSAAYVDPVTTTLTTMLKNPVQCAINEQEICPFTAHPTVAFPFSLMTARASVSHTHYRGTSLIRSSPPPRATVGP